MLRVNNLNLQYGKSQILYDVSLRAEPGKITCVIGTNGVGKTSLLRAISGAHPISGGDIVLDGGSVGHLASHHRARAGIGYVPQGRDVFPLMTVLENLKTGFACLPKNDHEVPKEVYDLFPVLHDMRHRRAGDLSGGQQQQLAIARALVTRPKLLLLDEPTEGIQPNIIQQIGEVIRLLRDQGQMAIVLVEQYFDFAFDLADGFVVLRRGAVILNANRAEVQRNEVLELVSV